MCSWNGIPFAFRCTVGFTSHCLTFLVGFETTYTAKNDRNWMFTFLMISLLSCSSNILSILSFRMDSVLRRCYTRIAHIFFDIQPSFSTKLFVYCSTLSLLTGVMGPPIDVLCCRSLFSSQQRLSLPRSGTPKSTSQTQSPMLSFLSKQTIT